MFIKSRSTAISMFFTFAVLATCGSCNGTEAPSPAPNGSTAEKDARGPSKDTPARSPAYRGPLLQMTGEERSPVKLWDAGGQPVFFPYYAFNKKGLGLIDRDYGLRLEGGCFFSGGAEAALGGGLKTSDGAFTLSAYLQPAAAPAAGEGQVIGYGPEQGPALFALLQDKDGMRFVIGVSDVRLLDKVPAEPMHLLVAVSKNEIACYVDGKPASSHPGSRENLAAWADGILFLGNNATDKRPWRGRLERVVLFNKALNAAEAGASAAALLEEVRKREPTPRIELKGTLLAQSDYPKPWDEGFTYREVLAISEYKVDTVVQGEYKEARIRVAEWQYVDRIFLTNSRKKIGAVYRLAVEPLDANPQLNTIQRADTLEMNLDATVYYDLSPIKALPADQQPRQAGVKQE